MGYSDTHNYPKGTVMNNPDVSLAIVIMEHNLELIGAAFGSKPSEKAIGKLYIFPGPDNETEEILTIADFLTRYDMVHPITDRYFTDVTRK